MRPLAVTQLTLPNGLVALINEDRSAPVVAVNVTYHFGAKDEQPGHMGLAHLCEHLMGEGSPNEPLPEKVFIQSIGGTSSRWAETSEDRMQFYATVPSNELETMLWLESDRMADPLSRADDEHVAAVREVIHQERLQNRETPVYGLALSAIQRVLLEPPYQIDPLGPMTDLDAANAADARAFCTPYYVPNNATIAISGDVSTPHVKTLIEKYFSSIPRRPAPPQPAIAPRALTANSRLVMEDARARFSMLLFAWHGASYDDPDRLPLLALASALSNGRSGRLNRLLVYDRGLATRVSVGVFDLERSGVFQIQVIPRPGASATLIEQLVDSVVADVIAHGVTPADIGPYQHAAPVVAITSLQTRAARADTLAHDEMFAGDPAAYAKQLERTMSLTAADVSRTARAYLARPHVILNLVPAGKLDLISHPELPYTNVTPTPAKVTP
ncbi:MAG TPA: pitrilysin family protein [Gemmatimonadaceae bacterium]|nr:pitrilysin family protein [Gemmatimonadaceae bacterium]